ncbi:siderophore-interacting protein [Alteromonas sp. CI.11.F.A3]|uniref:siderophore-interacting protein n=1 Tax=Alteromonas sp. CI.11.F.A3 TaxID=3079555 RepID=UPI0029422B44|nr:siderophore-interacting protein [Alteromonas sp. CI.11.F.A3]WOI36362.1 siderophore-interacting protein [Alteromonas sp. CI.11.F.A3]
MATRPAPRNLVVINSRYITPNMLRITLGGEEMSDFPADQDSAYVKLIFPRADGGRPMMRTYTVRSQTENSIDVDFALHEAKGPASSWAVSAKVGDKIIVGGPGPKKLLNQDADWVIICGDMTALPAISVNLAILPKDTKGYAVLEVVDDADIQDLVHPDNVQLIWVVNKPSANTEVLPLLERIKSLPSFEGNLSVWVACEFNTMKAIRKYLRNTFELPKSHFYTSSYWKLGVSEDEHKIAKREDNGS